VDHHPRWHFPTRRPHRRAEPDRRALARLALELLAGRARDRRGHAPAVPQLGVGGVRDGVDLELRHIRLPDLDLGHGPYAGAMPERELITLELDGHEVRFTSPSKVVFPEPGHTKLDLCNYYLDVADACIAPLRDRPTTMKRFHEGAGGEFFFQKRVPNNAPEWLQQWTLTFPSGRNANFLTVQDRAHMAWGLNLNVIDWNPWPVRRPDADHPDELRVDLDPTPEAAWEDVRAVTMCVREVLEEHGLRGFPKTSGSRGIHVLVRIEQRWTVTEVRRAALALAREVERRMPEPATCAW